MRVRRDLAVKDLPLNRSTHGLTALSEVKDGVLGGLSTIHPESSNPLATFGISGTFQNCYLPRGFLAVYPSDHRAVAPEYGHFYLQ
jgi:hypothetical protein